MRVSIEGISLRELASRFDLNGDSFCHETREYRSLSNSFFRLTLRFVEIIVKGNKVAFFWNFCTPITNRGIHDTTRLVEKFVSKFHQLYFSNAMKASSRTNITKIFWVFFLGIFQRFSRCRLFEMKKLLFSVLSKIFLVIFVVYKNRRSINRKSVVRVNGSWERNLVKIEC